MTRSRLRWAIALPLVLVGTTMAHALAYVLVFPSASSRTSELAATGHGYLDQLPLALALLFGFLLVGLAANVAAVVRGKVGRAASPWLLASLPPLVFTLQEHLERYVHSGHLPIDVALEPAFGVGLALQLPFALVALLVARFLSRAADTLGSGLGTTVWSAPGRPTPQIAPCSVVLPRVPVLAAGFGTRGPPFG